MKGQKVLIIVDMQNDFINGTLANKDAEEIVPRIVEKIKSFDGRIIATLDTHQDKKYLFTQEGKRLPIKHCIQGTVGHDLVQPIQDALNEKQGVYYVDKPTFGTTIYANLIADYDEAEFCGTCTDICVVSNAIILKALCPEIRITVNADLCAGTTKDNHNAALQVMRCCQIDIVGEDRHD